MKEIFLSENSAHPSSFPLENLLHVESFGASFANSAAATETLARFTNLKSLAVRGWFNRNYNFLESLTNLTKLNLGFHTVTSELLSLPNLRNLALGSKGTQIPQWITKLEILFCVSWVFEWKPEAISENTDLKSLKITPPIKKSAKLSGLPNLRSLKVSARSGLTLDDVGELPQLEKFSIFVENFASAPGYERWSGALTEDCRDVFFGHNLLQK
jgi:hypothetical protein